MENCWLKMWEISGKIFVINLWEIIVENLWQILLVKNVGNQWENSREKSVGNDCVKFVAKKRRIYVKNGC